MGICLAYDASRITMGSVRWSLNDRTITVQHAALRLTWKMDCVSLDMITIYVLLHMAQTFRIFPIPLETTTS